MSWSLFIQILRATFTFDWGIDVPGISILLTALVSNIVAPAGNPIFTYIMTGLGGLYLLIKIINAILTFKSIRLDNRLKQKKLKND